MEQFCSADYHLLLNLRNIGSCKPVQHKSKLVVTLTLSSVLQTPWQVLHITNLQLVILRQEYFLLSLKSTNSVYQWQFVIFDTVV